MLFNVYHQKTKKKTKTKQKGNQLGPPQDSPRTVIFYSTGLFIHIHTDFMFIPTRSILQINLLIEYWCFYSKNYHIVLVRKLWVTLVVSIQQKKQKKKNPRCQFGTGSLSKPKGLWQGVGSKRGGWGDIGEWEPTPNMRSDWYIFFSFSFFLGTVF